MRKRIKKLLPAVALVGASTALIGFVLISYQRASFLVDTGETRPAVEATVARLQALRPASVDDPALRRAVEETLHAPYVATVWLFAPDGRVVYSAGSAAIRGQGSAGDLATDEARRLLATLPEGALSEQQRTWILTASAIQAEGEHNDVYRHMLRLVHAPDDSVVALLGVAYDVSPAVGEPALGWIGGLLIWLLAVGVYWLALPLWVWLDAHERGERAWIWAAFVFIGNLVALIAYVLAVRPRPFTEDPARIR